jgi:hypothetical protein
VKTRTATLFPWLRAYARAQRGLIANTVKFSKLALRGKLMTLPMNVITDEFAFSLAPEGWNYYSALLAEYERQPGIPPEKTTYYRFFQHPRLNQLRSLEDILYLHEPSRRQGPNGFTFHLGVYPWGGLNETHSLAGGTPFGWHYDQVTGAMTRDRWGYKRTLWYQPRDSETLNVEWNLTIHNLLTLRQGYRPLLHGSVPCVCLLVRRDGSVRGVMGDGHHRLAVLHHLGLRQVTVQIVQRVEEARVAEWYYVKSGQSSTGQALEIFNAFFELTGRERLLALNL